MLLSEIDATFEPEQLSVQTNMILKVFYVCRAQCLGSLQGNEDGANRADYWQECQLAGVSVHDQA